MIRCGAKVNQVDHTGSTALHYAACLGYYNVIGVLLSKKAITSLKDSQVGVACFTKEFYWRSLIRVRQLFTWRQYQPALLPSNSYSSEGAEFFTSCDV